MRTKVMALTMAGVMLFGSLAPALAGGNGSQEERRLRVEAMIAPYRDVIEEHATYYGVDPRLVAAVIAVESKGDPSATSYAGAAGLMQLMPSVCADFGVADPYDPYHNVRGGTALLAKHLQKYKGNLEKVLAAYNAGPKRVDTGVWRKIGQTRRYVPAVLAYYRALKTGEEYGDPIEVAPPAPTVNYVEVAFAALQTPESPLTLSADLNEAAKVAMADYIAGKYGERGARDRAIRHLGKKAPKELETYMFSTGSVEAFADAWVSQPRPGGNVLGVARAAGREGHIWLVIRASE